MFRRLAGYNNTRSLFRDAGHKEHFGSFCDQLHQLQDKLGAPRERGCGDH